MDDNSLDLDDLAAGGHVPITMTRYYIVLLAFFWSAFLITVTGINDDPWFLLAVGGLGMVQNVFAAGASRRPEAFGIHLELSDIVARVTVMDTLKDLETKYPGVGAALVDTFFPGKPLPQDTVWWEKSRKAINGRE
jgi:hypothetical protein